MTGAVHRYTPAQIVTWLRGLLTLAWADGNFDAQEQRLIGELTQAELVPSVNLESLEQISPDELAAGLGQDTQIAENFLRTAVMVAIADGTYSASEDQLLQQFCQALGQQLDVLEALRLTLCHQPGASDPSIQKISPPALDPSSLETPTSSEPNHDPLTPVRDWLDGLEIQDPQVARFLCKMIPPQCPFERDIKLFDHKIVHIPPLCKLNPLYEQLVGLRFRALSYLADEQGEDVSAYI